MFVLLIYLLYFTLLYCPTVSWTHGHHFDFGHDNNGDNNTDQYDIIKYTTAI